MDITWIALEVDCIGLKTLFCLLNCSRLRSKMKSGQMGIHWIAIELDWIGLETRRGIVGEIRSRAEIRISQMPTTAGRQFFLEVFKN